MPEIKNTFLKSKMNKDLDARLVPNGQYRDARNVSISRSEGADVGALENVLGNKAITTLKRNLGFLEDAKNNAKYISVQSNVVLNGLEIIGYFMDVTNDRIFLFLTDYIDSSNDRLSNFAPGDVIKNKTEFIAKGPACYIVQYNIKSENIINDYRVLVAGNFLNFSKTHPIINVNFIEGLLFFTDNRNQPRKINVDFAFNNSYEFSGANDPYYYTEDQISVAKFAPYEAPSFLDTSDNSGLLDVSNKYLAAHIADTLSVNTGAGGNTFAFNGGPYLVTGNNPDIQGGGADIGDLIIFPEQDNNPIQGNFTNFGSAVVNTAANLEEGIYTGVTGVTEGYTLERGGNEIFSASVSLTVKVNASLSTTGSIIQVNNISGDLQNSDVIKITEAALKNNSGSATTTAVTLTFNKINKVDKAVELEIQTAAQNGVTTVNPTNVQIGKNSLFFIKRRNPFYEDLYTGDDRLLKDKFARFSYRFKYDDGEYSLMAPFTQAAFVPNQFGYFVGDDEQKTLKSGDVDFFENSISKVKLNILLPFSGSTIENKLKVKEIQILVKNSDELAVRVVEDVPVSKLSSITTQNYVYEYLSSKPVKSLPEADLIRVSDKIPIRALTQEIVGNRVVYGNYVEKHATPDYLLYSIKYRQKTYAQDEVNRKFTTEFLTHHVKQNRSYQIGIVLFDRYGRASNVIFSDPDHITSNFKNSTISTSYSNFGLSSVHFWGNYLSFLLDAVIPQSDKIGYPGLYSESNPLGYYSYRIVIKQQEQEYYNVYTPGILAGEINWSTIGKQNKTASYNADELLPKYRNPGKFSNISLQGDNINKIPRDLQDANANDIEFSSSTLLTNRVNPDKLNVSSNVSIPDLRYFNTQNQNANKKPSKVTSIIPFKDLGEWTKKKGSLFNGGRQQVSTSSTSEDPKPNPWYPYYLDTLDNTVYHFADIFFNSTKNPFIATIETDFQLGLKPAYSGQLNNEAKRKAVEAAWQSLGVFETNPVKSNLEIYYESSSSGLISDLNDQVLSGSNLDIGPASLLDENGNSSPNLSFFANENLPLNSPCTTFFEAIDHNGTPCNDPFNTMTIKKVFDGNNVDRTQDNLFAIQQQSGGGNNNFLFRLITNSEFVYLQNSDVDDSFTFILTVTANSITADITLNNCRLQNTRPEISNIFVGQGQFGPPLGGPSNNGFSPSTVPDPLYPNNIALPMSGNSYTNQWMYQVFTFDVVNGSINNNRNHEELVCEVYESSTGGGFIPSAYFTVSNNNIFGNDISPKFSVVPNNAAITSYFQGKPLNSVLELNGFHVKVFDANKTLVTDVSPLPEDPNNPGVISTRTIKFLNNYQ